MNEDTVQTAVGLLRRDELDVKEIVTETLDNREIVTEWRIKRAGAFHGEDVEGRPVVVEVKAGDIVKRDAHIIVKRGQPLGAAQASIG